MDSFEGIEAVSRISPVDASRIQAEKNFTNAVREYLKYPRGFQFGGLVNALGTIEIICRELHEEAKHGHYLTAANRLNDVAGELDLPYRG